MQDILNAIVIIVGSALVIWLAALYARRMWRRAVATDDWAARDARTEIIEDNAYLRALRGAKAEPSFADVALTARRPAVGPAVEQLPDPDPEPEWDAVLVSGDDGWRWIGERLLPPAWTGELPMSDWLRELLVEAAA